MNFLQPWVLWAIPAIALPIAIHLIHKRRQKVVEWGAMMFLLEGAKLSRGMQRLRHFLLLTLRTLAVLGLIIGLGRPIAGGLLGGLGGGRPDMVLVLLDRSASMREQFSPGGPSKLDLGVERIVDALQNIEASRFACIDSVSLLVTEFDSPDDLLGLPLTGTTDSHCDLPALLEVAAEHLRVNAAGRAEIWICSDGQPGDWQAEDGRWPVLQDALLELSAGVRVNILSFEERSPDNQSVRVTRAQRLGGPNGAELLLDLVVQGEPDAEGKRSVPVAVQVGGARSVVAAELVGGIAEVSGHRLPVDPVAGASWGFVELPSDGNPADDRFYFTYGAEGVQETVIVTEQESSSQVLDFAARAPQGEGLEFATRVIAAEDSRGLDLTGSALLLWQAPLPEDELALEVENFLGAGGQVVFLPPAAATEASFLGCSWGTSQVLGEADGGLSPSSWRREGDLLRDGEDGTALSLKQLEISGWTPVEGDVTPLATLEGGEVLLSRAPTSRGGLYFLGTTTEVQDSNLARQGLVLVALVQRALAAATEAIGARGQQIAGAFVPTLGQYQRLGESDPDWLLSEHLQHAGVVQSEQALVALNRDLAEDDRSALTGDRLVELLPEVDVSLVAAGAAEASLVEEVWRVFLILLLIALVGEALLCVTESSPAKEPRS